MAHVFLGVIPLLLLLLIMGLKQMVYIFLAAFSLSFVVRLVEGIWSIIIPPPFLLTKTANLIRKMEKSNRKKLETLLYGMCYRKLRDRYKDGLVKLAFVCWLQRHMPVTVVCVWAVPGVLLFLHYLGARGCGFNTIRPYMETYGLCFPNSQNSNTIRLLKFREDQPSITDHSETHSYYIRTIILSHLSMHHAQLTWQEQAIKLRDALPDGIEGDKVMDTLSKLYVLPHRGSEANSLCPGTDQSVSTVSNLTTQMNKFAPTLCMEKDIMTIALQSFVDAYSVFITISDYRALSLASFAFYPWGHSLRLLNRQWLSPLLPEPRIYAFEIEAELRFRKVGLIDTIHQSLALLRASSPAIGNFDSLEEAISAFATQLEIVEQMIRESDFSRWPWSPNSNRMSMLQKYHKLLKRTHDHLVAVFKDAGVYEIMLSSLWNDLQPLRQTFSQRLPSKFTSTGSLAVPEVLLVQLQNASFVSPWQSSSINQDRDGSEVFDIPRNTSLFGYSLNNADGPQLLARRAAIAQHCKEGNIGDNLENYLYTICTINHHLAATMSGLDNDALSSTARSWRGERVRMIQNFEKKTRWDLDGVQRALEKMVDEGTY